MVADPDLTLILPFRGYFPIEGDSLGVEANTAQWGELIPAGIANDFASVPWSTSCSNQPWVAFDPFIWGLTLAAL